MSGTFSQLYIQCIFAVKGRQNLLKKEWRPELFKYMAGIITNKGHKPIIINGVSDHVHLLIGLKPSMAISDLVRDIKNNSSNFINSKKLVLGKFCWQEGFGAFSYSQSHLDTVYKYIQNQETHHQKKSFKEEYESFLELYKVNYESQYLFDWIHETDLNKKREK